LQAEAGRSIEDFLNEMYSLDSTPNKNH